MLAETKIHDMSRAAKIDASEVGSVLGLDTGCRIRDGSCRKAATAVCQCRRILSNDRLYARNIRISSNIGSSGTLVIDIYHIH